MRLSRALNDKKMDTRLRDKLLAEDKVTKDEEKKYLSELPDDAEKATFTEKEQAE